MDKKYKIGTPLTFVWRFLKSNNDPFYFDPDKHTFRLRYYTGIGSKDVSSFMLNATHDAITWTLPAEEEVFAGNYDLLLDVFAEGLPVGHFHYNEAFSLYMTYGGDSQNAEQVNVGETITLLSVAEFQHFAAGDSAYQIAVKNGYEGTEQEWLKDPVNGIKGNGIKSVEVVGEYSSEDSAENTYRITPDVGDPFDLKVKNGKGIASIEQTASPSESEGTNVFLVTMSDGTTATFQVKNGARGNSGYTGAAEELEVVNDLDADDPDADAAKALSAYQGYVLDGKVTELGQDMRTIPIFDISAYNDDKTYPEFGQAVIGDIPISERRSGMMIKFRRHIEGEQAFNDVYLHFLYTLPYANTTTGNSRFGDIYNWAAIKDTIGNYVYDKNIALGKTVKEAIDVVHRKIDGIVTYNLPILTKDVGRRICRINANIGKLFKIEVVSNTATIGGTGNFTIHTNFGYDSFPSTQGASKQFSFNGDVEYIEFYVSANDGVTVEGDVVLKVTNYNGSSIKEILEDGIYIYSGTTTVATGSSATFFNEDVAIPKGSVIKLEVVSGYPDIIKEPRYNINNTGNVLADGPVTLIEAIEDVTHIMYGVSTSRVVANGDVVTRISVLSVKDDIAEVKKKIGDLDTSVGSLDERVEALEEGADTSPYSQYIDAVAQKVFDEISETSETNEEKAIFVHITDTHGGGIRSSYGMTLDRTRLHMNMVGKVAKAVNAKFVIHTGDAIDGYDATSEPTPDSYMALVRGYSEDIPLIFSEGNYSHDFGKPNEKLVRGQVQSYFGRGKKWLEDKVQYNSTDSVKSYFYFDDEKTKIRYIILDAQDAIREGWHPTGGRNAYGFSQEQRTFVSDALDDALSNNLSVFFFAHMPPTANLFPNITGEDASYGIETDGHGDLLIAEIKSFTDAGGVVLGYSFGHNHFDNQYYDSVTKIPYIGLVCDAPSKLVRDSINWGTISAWDRDKDDYTQFAFDVYVISPVSKKVKMFRFGAGIDRTYTLPNNP